MNNTIFGRESELALLENIYESDNAEFVTIYGRRRIGKTWLIREFFSQKDCIFFKTTGMVSETKMSPAII